MVEVEWGGFLAWEGEFLVIWEFFLACFLRFSYCFKGVVRRTFCVSHLEDHAAAHTPSTHHPPPKHH